MNPFYRGLAEMSKWLSGRRDAPRLTLRRAMMALGVALMTDILQLFSGALGWFGWDQCLDLLAMLVLSRLIGFHLLFLPTFLLDVLPLADDLPSWTACVVVVCLWRWRKGSPDGGS